MVTHIVLFKLKDPSPENLRLTAGVLSAMDGKIPELVDIEVGIDQLKSERSFDIALRTRHRSWDELNAYQVHPIHQEVLKHMKSVVEKSVAVDWEA
ncbi:MAG: Dabb family protein [Polyangiales bacterium]